MDPREIERRRMAALGDIDRLGVSDDATIRVLDYGDVLVIARVPARADRPGVMQVIQRHFPGAPVKFEP
jgi:hypothetical protein